jgi:lipid-A-disaccharide synthase
MKKIFWLAGEKSGDTHGSKVMERLNDIAPHIQHIGIGGPLMMSQGLQTRFPFVKFCVMGFVEILTRIPFFLKAERDIKTLLTTEKPDIVVLIDYPGLNLRIAKIASDLDIKVLYYIIPQFWAWKHHRVYKLQRYCTHIACILPFEKELLDIHQIDSTYVGHPVVEEIDIKLSRKQFADFFELDPQKKWISFFPGSRLNEVKNLLPIFLKAIKKLRKEKPDYQFLISKANSVGHSDFMRLIPDTNGIHLVDGYSYEQMKYSDFMIIKSGTSTIEAASIETPFAIVYIANPISYHIAKKIVKVRYIGLPNLIFDEPVVTELIQNEVNPDKIVEIILSYTNDETAYQQLANKLKEIHEHLGKRSAAKSVTDIIIKLIS